MSKKFHKELLDLIQQHAGKPTQHTDNDAYLGNSHYRYPISIPVMRKFIKAWAESHKDISVEELTTLMTMLIKAPSSTEKITAGILLDYMPKQRVQLDPELYNDWLEHVEGWAEIDGLCQGHFQVNEMLDNWSVWKKLITKFSKSENINKRRAAMVFLITPALNSSDERFSTISLEVIERTKHERDILISKAISWLLRSMTKHQRVALEKYLKEQQDTLPKVVVREVMVKLTTGTKSGKSRKNK